MLDFQNMIDRQLMMFLLLGLGVVLAKLRMVDDHSRGVIGEITLKILMPCSILSSFLTTPYEPGLLRSFFLALGLGFGIHLFCLVLAIVLYRNVEKGKRAVLRFGTISSNAAFIGVPMVEGMFGAVGVLYAAAYLVSMNLFSWSFGISFFTEPGKEQGGAKIAAVAKNTVTQPAILASVLGVVLLVSRLALPGFLTTTISNVGHCTTVFSMVVVGHVMSKVRLRSLFTRQSLLFCLLRLGAIPLVTLGLLLLLRPDPLVTAVMVVLAGMPAATATAMVADRYHVETAFASKIVSLSTAFSMGTIPLLATLASHVA